MILRSTGGGFPGSEINMEQEHMNESVGDYSRAMF